MTVPKLKKKVYSIGGSPELVVYGDINPVFAATELIPSEDHTAEPERDAIRIFFLGGTQAAAAPLEIPPDTRPVFEDSDVTIKAKGAYRYGEWYGRARSITDLERKLAIIVLPGLKPLNKDFISRFIFRPILDSLLSERGYIPIHAAGIAFGTGGCIIAGPAGSGKTSLLTGLVERGFGFMADDRILVKEDSVKGVCMHAFPEYIRCAVTARGPKRLVLPPPTAIETTPVHFILILEGKSAINTPSLKAIGKAEAAARLFQFISANLEPFARHRAFNIIGDLCDISNAYVVRGWGNPRAVIRLTADILEGKM